MSTFPHIFFTYTARAVAIYSQSFLHKPAPPFYLQFWASFKRKLSIHAVIGVPLFLNLNILENVSKGSSRPKYFILVRASIYSLNKNSLCIYVGQIGMNVTK